MENTEAVYELPENFEELKRAANRTSDWRARLEAVQGLGEYNSKPAIAILTRLAANDPVYTVQEAAYGKLQAFGVEAAAPQKNRPEPVKGLAKIILRIQKSLPKGHAYEEFKNKLKKMRIDIYDVYEGEKGEQFDAWLEKQWKASFDRRPKPE